VVVGAAVLYCLLPLTAPLPVVSPEVFVPFNPQHEYKAPGIMAFAPVLAGIAVVTVCACIYFWLTALPPRLRYRRHR
jgi:hypothetical protein